MDNSPKAKATRPYLRLVSEDEVKSVTANIKAAALITPPKSAIARELTRFADDLDKQIALLLASD